MPHSLRLVAASIAGALFILLGPSPPARAALEPEALNTDLLAARGSAEAALKEGLATVEKETRTQESFDKIKDKLPETWKKGVDAAIGKYVAALAKKRLEVLDKLADSPSKVEPVATALKAQSDAQKGALDEGATELEKAAKEFAKTDDAKDPAKAADKFAALAKEIPKKVGDADWAKALVAAQKALSGKTANEQVAEAARAVDKFVKTTEKNYKRVVQCEFKAGALTCNGDLAVSGAEISTIEVTGLPTDRDVTVSARAAKDAPTGCLGGSIDPEADTITLPKGTSDEVSIDVYTRRWFLKTYRDGYLHFPEEDQRKEIQKAAEQRGESCTSANLDDRRVRAAWSFRCNPAVPANQSGGKPNPAQRTHLALIVSGISPRIVVQVKVGDGQGAGELVTTPIGLGYARWGVDTGGFFSVARISDEEVVTEPAGTNMVKVTKVRGGNDYTQDSGILLTLVPRNYPHAGIGIGFSSNDQQPNTFYVGPSVRFLTYENRAVGSFSAGLTMRSVKRFPGLSGLTDPIGATDPRLQGKQEYKFSWYAMLQLGFAFGRVPGGS